MKVYVVNCSPDVYNLACHKAANWYRRQGHEVVEQNVLDWFSYGDLALLSVVFTRDLEDAAQYAMLARHKGMEVRVGGPALTMTSDWFLRNTGGIIPHVGLAEFDREPGQYDWTFTSRGCPRNCPFCLVTKLEGPKVVEFDDFNPAPNIGDNNILMTSDRHQEVVIQRTLEAGFTSVDVNSGFDCRVFANDPEWYFARWSRLPLAMWRFAFDGPDEERSIRTVFEFLRGKGMDRHKVQAYVLSNFPGTSPEEVIRRAEVIKSYGMMPYLMVFRPVDSVKNNYVAPGWDKLTISRLVGYYNQPSVWMSCSFAEYCCSRGAERATL